MGEWKPIADAPRDGTLILACDYREGTVGLIRWRRFTGEDWEQTDSDTRKRVETQKEGWAGDYGDSPAFFRPQHFIFIPRLPPHERPPIQAVGCGAGKDGGIRRRRITK